MVDWSRILSTPLTVDEVKLLANTRIKETRDAAKQYETFQVEPGKVWIVQGATVINDTVAAVAYANFKFGNQQLTTQAQTAASSNLAANCLYGLIPPLVMISGETLVLFNHNYVGGHAVTFAIKFSEFNLDEVLK